MDDDDDATPKLGGVVRIVRHPLFVVVDEGIVIVLVGNLERATGFEPATLSLGS